MDPKDHERYRRQLELQLRTDMELLYAAYQTKLRAYEIVHQFPGDLAIGLRPLPELLQLSAPALPAAPTGPAAAPPAPAPPSRSPANELRQSILAALPRLPEVFDRKDVIAALEREPPRATLHRVLQELAEDGRLAVESYGEGTQATLYRKLAVDVPETSDH